MGSASVLWHLLPPLLADSRNHGDWCTCPTCAFLCRCPTRGHVILLKVASYYSRSCHITRGHVILKETISRIHVNVETVHIFNLYMQRNSSKSTTTEALLLFTMHTSPVKWTTWFCTGRWSTGCGHGKPGKRSAWMVTEVAVFAPVTNYSMETENDASARLTWCAVPVIEMHVIGLIRQFIRCTLNCCGVIWVNFWERNE